MRILISLLIVAAVAAAGGVFVLAQRLEADDLRLQLIREAEAITGRDVSVEGRVDLSFWPQPTLSVAGATLGDLQAPGGAAHLTVDRVDLQIKPLPLLRGEVVVTAVRLVRPVLHVDAAEGLASLPQLGEGAPFLPFASLGVRRLSVIDGRASFGERAEGARPGSPTFERINLELEADDRRGPFSVTGDFYTDEHGFRVAARLGRITTDPSTTLQLELVTAQPSADAARLTYRGLVLTDDEVRLRGRLTLAGDDAQAGIRAAAVVLGHAAPELPGWLGQPYEVSGALTASREQAELGELLVTVAGTEAQGRMEVAFGTTPAIDLSLALASLQLSERWPIDWSALDLATDAAHWLEGKVDLTIGLLGYRNEAVRRVRLTVGLTGQEVAIEQARGLLPGNADVTFTGGLHGTGGEAVLRGSLTGVTDDLGALLRWLDLDPDGVTLDHLRTLGLSTRLSLSPSAIRLHEVEARLGPSRVTGSLAFELDGRNRLAAALAVDRLDLDAYWPAADPAEAFGVIRRWLAQMDAAVDADVDRLTWQGLRWQDVHLEGRAVDQRISLKHLSAEGIAESRAELRGEVDLTAERLDFTAGLSAPRPALLLRRLGLQPPVALARFGPTELSGTARGWRERTDVDLKLESGEMEMALAGQLAWPERGPATYEFQIAASHPDYADLVHSLGQSWRQGETSSAPFELTGRLRGDAGGRIGMVGSAGFGPTRVTGEVSWREEAERPRLVARLSLGEPRLDTLMPLLSLGGVSIDPGQFARQVIGNWPAQPIALDWLAHADGSLELTGKGGFAGDGLELRAGLDDGLLVVERFAAEAFGGSMELEASLDLRRRLPFVAAALSLKEVDVPRLSGWLELPPVLEGRGDLSAEATAIGDNAYDLWRTLTGDLQIRLRDGRILGLPLEHPTGAARDGPQISVEPAGIEIELNPAELPPLEFAELEGRFEIKRGIAEATETMLRLDDRAGRVEGLVDLLIWVADLQLVIEQQDSSEPAMVKIVGPLDDPQVLRLSPEGERASLPAP